MKQVLLISVLCCLTSALKAERIYVSPQGQGQTGSSWSDAIDLHQALAIAEFGDQIWAMQGTYSCSQDGSREGRFVIPSGVAIYGGFAGHESSLEERALQQPTILSGELGDQNATNDNAYTVVYIADADQNTLLDGLTISGGYARFRSRDRSIQTCGGGLVIAAKQTICQPVIQNCVIVNNKARYGAGVYVDGRQMAAAPTFNNCIFAENTDAFRGGGLYNDGENGSANSLINACTFKSNEADYGAGITNNGTRGESNPLVVETSFVENMSMSNGAAIYNEHAGQGMVNPVVQACTFIGNESEIGEDVAHSHRVSMTSSMMQTGQTLQPNRH